MGTFRDQAEEELDITKELSHRLVDLLNGFSEEYKGNILGHHVCMAVISVMLECFRSNELPLEEVKRRFEWALWMYSERPKE